MEPIYKFRDWANDYHKEVLKDRLFFCASIADFNDPFDSRIPINYMGLTDKERIEVVEEHVRQKFPGLLGKDRIEMVEQVFRESAITDPEQLRKNYREVVLPMIEEEVGVLSFTGNKENILLWSHYSNSRKEFCVGVDRKNWKK